MNVRIGVGAQVKLARLMVITDTRAEHGDLAAFLEAAVPGGVDLVQIREPALDHQVELAALRTAWQVASRYRHQVVVSDSADLAADFGADLVQSADPADDAPARLKSRLGRFARLGVEVTDSGQLARRLADPAVDFLLVDAVDDLALAAEAAELAPVTSLESKPWFAVGAFDTDRLDAAIAVGVRRVAVSADVTEAPDPRAAAQRLSHRLREVWAADPELTRLTFAALAEQA